MMFLEHTVALSILVINISAVNCTYKMSPHISPVRNLRCVVGVRGVIKYKVIN